MKKRSLQKLLSKSFFQAALIPLIVIELTLLVMYFGISTFMVNKSKNSLYEEIKVNVNSILQNEANNINFKLKEVSNLALILQDEQQRMFEKKENILAITDNSIKFDFAPNNVYYKLNDNGGSSVFYGINHKIENEQIQKALFTEAFDPMLKYVVESNDLIVASYFNSYDDMNRLYPFIQDVHTQYDPTINMEDYNFYYEADIKHNPSKKPVWTNAYLDPAGLGWMVSCIVPIYTNEFLEGVTGLDVTIDSFVKNILDLQLPWQASAFMVGKDGTILAMPQNIEKIFGLKELKEHSYTDVITQTQEKPDELNIIKNKNISPYFEKSLKEDKTLHEINVDNKYYILAAMNIEETNWKLFVMLDKDIVYAPVNEVEQVAKKIGWIAIVGMILFYVVFFIYIYFKVKKISKEISEPISDLAQSTKNFSKYLTKIDHTETEILEIDILGKNFNEMSLELHRKAQELKEINNSLEERVVYELKKNRAKDEAMLYQSRLAQMGEMISMIAHQWRQPLAVISSIAVGINLKLQLKKFDLNTQDGQEKFTKYLYSEINELELVTQNMTHTIDKFRDFYKPDQKEDLEEFPKMIDTSLELLEEDIKNNEIIIEKHYDENLQKAMVFKNDLIQVFINILRNAMEKFIENQIENRVIVISAKQIDKKIQISFKDNAGGISSDVIDKIFEPYFSTKLEKNGTGLGLYMSKLMIEKHHDGTLSVKSENGSAEFIIEI